MPIERLKEITISDEDINWAESVMGQNIHFDQERINVIKNLDTVDVQAYPGSGKTTTLIAKLAILAKKWPYTNAGICVLSHTNVAKEEIEDRLGNTEEGGKLLSYPHFIGTFQAFFDKYVASPWLKSKGFNINLVDKEIVIEKRWYKLSWGTQYYLQQHNKDEKICEYQGGIGDIALKSNGKTKNEIIRAIEESQRNGDFTYEEMLLYAEQALINCHYFALGLQQRFPVIFIDEAQDTNSFQWNLLDKVFSERSTTQIRQRFGDSNQAIYNYIGDKGTNNNFPNANKLIMNKSYRFDERIAVLANTVALNSEEMHGENNEFSERKPQNTIFLFSANADKTKQVIDEFAKLVLRTFSDADLKQYDKYGCHAIGHVHEKKNDTLPQYFPKGIFDYWPLYDANIGKKRENMRYIIDYFRKGEAEFNKGKELSTKVAFIAKGIIMFVNKGKIDNFIPSTSNSLHSILLRLSEEDQIKFRGILKQLTFADITANDKWKDIQKILKREIAPLFNVKLNGDTLKFSVWKDIKTENSNDTEQKQEVPSNKYKYVDSTSGRHVEIEFGSIHSVKGRTHLATIVLETFYSGFNMHAIMPFLQNMHPNRINKTNQDRLKCQYVAMTRAKGLLCLAIPITSVDEEMRSSLQSLGWQIKEIV